MTIFEVFALLITLTALFSYLNCRYVGLPTSVGVMLIALVVSGVLIALRAAGFEETRIASRFLERIDFDAALLQGALSFLLFAGALNINLAELAEEKWTVAALAIVGVVISTVVAGTAIYWGTRWAGLPLDYEWALVFGALISPTDPIAVLGILKRARVPRSLEIQIAGESLFNDGTGVVMFLVLSGIAIGGHHPTAGQVGLMFVQQALGGAALGVVLGWITILLLKSVDNYRVEVLITLALVMGGYALAMALGTSGPIAIVCAGVLVGNQGRALAMSDTTRHHVDTFWELIDDMLNAVLFVLIGFEVLVLTFSRRLFVAGLVAVGAVLLARWISVALPVAAMHRWRPLARGTVAILTWSGVRGGISVAMALSLPEGRERDIVLAMTYAVVAFSVVVQGLTINRFIRAVLPGGDTGASGPDRPESP
ncbi:MAG TPA: sodium:proton antiporter [Candidatus Didemnitutus sp.]|jgi:CPA1 family monovalent cation:H+ antiporter